MITDYARRLMTPYAMSNYIPVPETGCWLWLGGWNGRYKYGRTHSQNHGFIETHRLFYMYHKGDIPPGMRVLHKCDTPPCCNPDHLFLGTQADNMADMHRKRRHRTRSKPAIAIGAAA